VTEAADGTAGVAAAATGRFDLILMDISMPGMNGTEAARAIREGGGPNAATPIVATTAHALPAEIESFRANGMPQTLTKPISRAALRALLAGYAPDEDTPDEAAPVADLLDPAKLAEFSETLGDTRFRDMIAQFVQDATAFEARLAAGQDGAAVLAATAHNLAGSAGMIGLPALQGLLAAFETAVKTTGALPPEALRADLLRTSAETRAELDDLVAAD
jgi:CheY-like chemotaxis protein